MNMTRRTILKSLAIVVSTAISGSVVAMDSSFTTGPADEADEMPDILTSSKQPLAAGRIVAIDRNAGKIAIEHIPISYLFMEKMTMIFRVADADSLYGLTAGDKIRFRVERDGKSYVITRVKNSN
jgi:Cu/Ag efflux protein CusF